MITIALSIASGILIAAIGAWFWVSAAQSKILSLSTEAAALKTENEFLKAQKEQHKAEFRSIAQEVLKATSGDLNDVSRKELKSLLIPLESGLRDFNKKIEDHREKDIKERVELKSEILRLAQLNQAMTHEANQLVHALKGDQKTQGNWGELVVERVLERSGLREGEEFTREGEGLGLKDMSGKHMRPDVIIHLPDEKHLVVDCKVSLVAYERYTSSSNEADKPQLLKDHLTSVRTHIDSLSKKHYHALEGLRAPELVFLFMPIEPAFILAHQGDESLATFAWERKIILVSPSTLLACLKAVASVWKHERQTRNALEIARQAGRLHDKFVGFLEDMGKVGSELEGAKSAYEAAMNKLKTGRGNLIDSTLKLQEYGAKTEKNLKNHQDSPSLDA